MAPFFRGRGLKWFAIACFCPIVSHAVNCVDSKPFPIIVFKGFKDERKPNDLEAFLGPLIVEIKELL